MGIKINSAVPDNQVQFIKKRTCSLELYPQKNRWEGKGRECTFGHWIK